jgi:hypothetical protein
MLPCTQTRVGGSTGTTTVASPATTRSLCATGSHEVPFVGSPGPGTSGVKRACAEAVWPARSTNGFGVKRRSRTTFVGNAAPVAPRSRTWGSPRSRHEPVSVLWIRSV